MDEEESYGDIQKVFDDIPDNFNILEEQIDIDEQFRYFELSKKLREKNKAVNELPENCDELFLPETSEERKKELLVSLALVPDVKAYRMIENYLKNADKQVRNWAVLAFQESRMLLQSTLLDEKQVFISTGLGGKGKKLRYYVVFISSSPDMMLESSQQKLLKDELIFALKKKDGEFESIDFSQGFASSLLLLPLKANLKDIFSEIIDECNQYGNFLAEDVILTNVKILTRSEIIDFINSGDNKEPPVESD
jgi:hypothetical protein